MFIDDAITTSSGNETSLTGTAPVPVPLVRFFSSLFGCWIFAVLFKFRNDLCCFSYITMSSSVISTDTVPACFAATPARPNFPPSARVTPTRASRPVENVFGFGVPRPKRVVRLFDGLTPRAEHSDNSDDEYLPDEDLYNEGIFEEVDSSTGTMPVRPNSPLSAYATPTRVSRSVENVFDFGAPFPKCVVGLFDGFAPRVGHEEHDDDDPEEEDEGISEDDDSEEEGISGDDSGSTATTELYDDDSNDGEGAVQRVPKCVVGLFDGLTPCVGHEEHDGDDDPGEEDEGISEDDGSEEEGISGEDSGSTAATELYYDYSNDGEGGVQCVPARSQMENLDPLNNFHIFGKFRHAYAVL
jgi:hypothetical protein